MIVPNAAKLSFGAYHVGSAKEVKLSGSADILPHSPALICPTCRENFIPRTSKQALCGLKCFGTKQTPK